MSGRYVKKFLNRYLLFLSVFHTVVLCKKSYLHLTGWIESLKRGYPCDQDGTEIPWMNYTVINILKERLNGDLSLFEFGSGYSTLFYAKRVHNVISIEYDKDWFNFIKERIPNNVSLIFRQKDIDGVYCRSVTEFNQEFDVVIVDGRDRVNCVKQSISVLSCRGVILLDDSQREKYQVAIEVALGNGFKALNLEGLKPTGSGIDRTTILYREGNCLGI
jgi:hypothetical protein